MIEAPVHDAWAEREAFHRYVKTRRVHDGGWLAAPHQEIADGMMDMIKARLDELDREHPEFRERYDLWVKRKH